MHVLLPMSNTIFLFVGSRIWSLTDYGNGEVLVCVHACVTYGRDYKSDFKNFFFGPDHLLFLSRLRHKISFDDRE